VNQKKMLKQATKPAAKVAAQHTLKRTLLTIHSRTIITKTVSTNIEPYKHRSKNNEQSQKHTKPH
jgi:hypothetical protein